MNALTRSLIASFVALSVVPALGQSLSGDMTVRELSSIMTERERANNQRFDAQEKAVAAALAAAKEAVVKAESAAEKRFDSVNEFRDTLKDQQQTFVTRTEIDIRFKALEEKIIGLQTRQDRTTGRTEGAEWLWGLILGLAGLAVGAAAVIFRARKPPARA